MNLLVFAPEHLYDTFPYAKISATYVLDNGSLECEALAELTSLIVVTEDSSQLSESLLAAVTDVIEVESDPGKYLASRGIPGDIAIINWDGEDDTYEILDLLCRSGVTVLDGADNYVQVTLDYDMSIDTLVETLVRRVTADVLRQVRAELNLDTPRRSRFRSSTGRA